MRNFRSFNSNFFCRDQECSVDNSNTTTFQVMLCIGIVFTILSALISFYLKKISARIIVRKDIFISIHLKSEDEQIYFPTYFSYVVNNLMCLLSVLKPYKTIAYHCCCVYHIFEQQLVCINC